MVVAFGLGVVTGVLGLVGVLSLSRSAGNADDLAEEMRRREDRLNVVVGDMLLMRMLLTPEQAAQFNEQCRERGDVA